MWRNSAGDLAHAVYRASTWTGDTIEASVDVGTDPTLAISAAGMLHVLFHDTSTGSLRVASRDASGGTWTFETIEMGATAGRWAAATTDASGALFVAYQRGREDDLYFARKISGAWMTERIDDAGNTGYHPQIALAADGTFHVVYYLLATLSDGELRYATGAPGAWHVSTLDPEFSTGAGNVSLALDPAGVPHAVYRAGAELRHAWSNGDGIDQDCDGSDG